MGGFRGGGIVNSEGNPGTAGLDGGVEGDGEDHGGLNLTFHEG
jgi:hypothetical protein